MQVVTYSEFRNNLAGCQNVVTNDSEIVVVSRSRGRNVVVLSLDEYNNMKETLSLNSTTASMKQLEQAIVEMNKRK